MHEFETIAYLDMQKTGTTTVVKALKVLLDEREIHRDIHGPIPRGFDKDKKCFISIRDPLSIYLSLFKFGAGSERGTLYSVLRKQGLSHYYQPTAEAFGHWLEFVLDPGNARHLSRTYAESGTADGMGVLTYRFLYLCIPKARGRMENFVDRERLEKVFQRKHAYSEYVRTEFLYEDLFALLRHWERDIKLKSPLTTLEDMIARVKTRNTSRAIEGLSSKSVSPKLLKLVQEREWLLYKTFGYDQTPSGIPSPFLANGTDARALAQKSAS